MLDQLVLAHLSAGLGDDERRRHLAQPAVGHADHERLGHRGVTHQQHLDLGGGDHEVADAERLPDPPSKEDVAVGVRHRQVAGPEPALRVEGGLRLVRLPVVAGRDKRSAETELAGPSRGLVGARFRIDNADGQPLGRAPSSRTG